jgi:hypothetical protein
LRKGTGKPHRNCSSQNSRLIDATCFLPPLAPPTRLLST